MSDGERELNESGFDYVELLVAASLAATMSVWAQLGCLAACVIASTF